MPSSNKIILASAGSGKTTMIIDDAGSYPYVPSAMITYTINNTSEICAKTYERIGFLPPQVTISTWYTFLLKHLIRPYQNCLYFPRVRRLCFVQGRSALGTKATDIRRHYFGPRGWIYVDKASKFACEIIRKTGGSPLHRLEQIFERIYIDESQDLAAYDLDLLEMVLKSHVAVTLVGDHRQATFSTNLAAKNKKYARANVIDKFKEWHKAGLCELQYQYHSHRCTQAICDFADRLHPDLPGTTSLNKTITGHDGVFAVPNSEVPTYIAAFNPQLLRYSRRQRALPGTPINFGSAKGMTFSRTLIFPHKAFEKYLMTGQIADAGKETAKIYVAITRARQSTAFVIPDGTKPANIPVYRAFK